MIQIKVNNLDELAKKHYGFLCNTFKFSVTTRLDSSLIKYKAKRLPIFKEYYKLLQYLKLNIEEIIIGKPIVLEKHKLKLKAICLNLGFNKETKNRLAPEKDILYDLTHIFNYETFSSTGFSKKTLNYSGNKLVQSIDLSVCPYCNRNTIFNIENKKRTSDLDHFYPQSKYPFFALSFYNLIPSCKICNQIKLDSDDKDYINPYDKRFDFNKNMKFHLEVKNATFHYIVKGFKIGCKFDNNILDEEKKRIKNNIDDFKLKNLYQNHKDTVLELVQKREIYSDSYIDELLYNYGSLFKNKEDLLRLITCGYVSDEDLHKRPLSKLIKDISEELELIGG